MRSAFCTCQIPRTAGIAWCVVGERFWGGWKSTVVAWGRDLQMYVLSWAEGGIEK